MGKKMSVMAYFERKSSEYQSSSSKGLWGWVKRRELAGVLEVLDPKGSDRVLELGCGTGYYSRCLHFKYGCSVLATDFSSEMVRKFRRNHPQIECSQLDCQSLPILGIFNKVIIAGVLEFVPDLEAVLKGCYDNLHPDGKVVVLVPPSGIVGALYTFIHRISGCPVVIRDVTEYRRLALSCGLRTLRVQNIFPMSIVIEFERLDSKKIN